MTDPVFFILPTIREYPAYFLLYKFSPKNTGQSKVKQSHKIDEVTTVASAQTPKTLQPGKCPFHYPAAGWIPPAFTDFFPPAADMLLKSVNTDFLADSWIIISFVQTEVSNFSPQKPAAHFPRIFQGWSCQAAVMHIGVCGRHTPKGQNRDERIGYGRRVVWYAFGTAGDIDIANSQPTPEQVQKFIQETEKMEMKSKLTNQKHHLTLRLR